MANLPRLPIPRSPRGQQPLIRLYNMRVLGRGALKSGDEHHIDRIASERSGGGGRIVTFHIAIPDGARPGEEFQVKAGGRIVRVRCPPHSKPGQHLQISVRINDEDDAGPREVSNFYPDSDDVIRVPEQELERGERAAYKVRIPPGVRGGQSFPVTINGHRLDVACPNMARPGMYVRVVPPPDVTDAATVSSSTSSQTSSHLALHTIAPSEKRTQMFEVVVPNGVVPGQPFALFAGGVRVLVTCPKNARVGQKIRFDLPVDLLMTRSDEPKGKLAEIKLSYDKDGWSRTIRATDMKFVWTRFDERGNVDDDRATFDADRSAYVLNFEYLDDSKYMRRGRVDLVAPERGVVDSRITRADGSVLVSYADIASAQMMSYKDKTQWFQATCAQLGSTWEQGHIKINIRRQFLLSDSIDAVLSLSREELRKPWRFHYIGEPGLDVGGLKREWFELVTKAAFDPVMGLWQSSAANQMCMQINPASEVCCPDDHLICFRFLGRVMGKALFDGEIVNGHMVKPLYKHLLGFPVMFKDLKGMDEEYYNSLKGLKDMGADVEYLYADFTATEEMLGAKQTVDLIPGGADISVTEDNLPQYLEACLQYRMFRRYDSQLRELLLGFYDVIPESILTIFDFQELELLMCGLPEIDLEDWMLHTEYSGWFEWEGANHQVCIWFWQIVSRWDQEMKARLLQFVTGTSGVPSNGFSCLQGNDGCIRKFTIHGLDFNTDAYPRSHTCFNRIDVPLYESRVELEEKLKVSITMAGTGFDIE